MQQIDNAGIVPVLQPLGELPVESTWSGRKIFLSIVGTLAAIGAVIGTVVAVIFLKMKLSKDESLEHFLSSPEESQKGNIESLKEGPQIEEFFSKHFQSYTPAIPFTLFDARPFIELRFKSKLSNKLSSEQLAQFEKIHANMAKYYETIRMKEEFENFEYEFKQNIAFSQMKVPGMLTNPFFKELCNEVLKKIEQKINAEPSISSHPRQLISKDEFHFLKGLKLKNQGFQTKILEIDQKIKQKMHKVNTCLKTYAELFLQLKRPHEQASVELVVKAKEALLAINLDIGRMFILSDLVVNDLLSNENQTGLASLFSYAKKRGEEIDLRLLKNLKEEHEEAPSHPIVAIEGGGPTGLLLAITQYQAGANIALFEKRSLQYERTQVVRLDPHWMAMLELYLGETYYQLFIDKGHKAIVRKDGFGEIVTKDLEDALHNQLTKLISLQNDNSLERFGAHEVKDVIKPLKPGGKFKLIAEYIGNQDKGITPKPNRTEVKDIDFLICAGGKSSTMLKAFMPSSVPVSSASYYGVCSWLTTNFKAQNPDTFNFFQDFRGVIPVNEKFLVDFQNRVLKRIALEHSAIPNGLSFKMEEWLEGPFLQTRTFENKGLIYIGMELPLSFSQFLARIQQSNNHLPKEKLNEVVKTIQTAWFELVGEYYSLESGLKIDSNFIATFPVEQNRLPQERSYCEIGAGNTRLMLVTAAGDAFASPHFMRYSGLTGARENILHLQSYMKSHIHQNQPEEKLLQVLAENGDRTAQFVIDRGNAFLTPLDKESILKSRKTAMRKSLAMAAKNWKENFASLSELAVDSFLLRWKGTDYYIQIMDDHLFVNGGSLKGNVFNSLKHLQLTLV